MKRFRVEGQQLARRKPKPWPIQVSVDSLDTPTSCIASKVTTLTRIPGSGALSL